MAHKPAAAKKAKPSFQVPTDTGTPESAAGWVFRETNAPAQARPHAAPASAAPASASASASAKSKSGGVLAAATEVFILGATSVGFATLAAMRLLEVPIAAGRMILPDRKRSV